MGRRGPAAKPTKLKILAGNPGKQRLNKAEPVFGARAVECPHWLDLEAQALWARLAPALLAQGLLTDASAPTLAMYCSAVSDWRRAAEQVTRTGDVIKQGAQVIPNPYLGIKRKAEQSALRLAAQFGLTPASAAGVQVTEQGGMDAFDAI